LKDGGESEKAHPLDFWVVSEPEAAQVACNACGVVLAPVLGKQSLYNDDTPEPQETVLVECPSCSQPIVAQRWYFETGMYMDGTTEGEFTKFKRVFPSPDPEISWEPPEAVRVSLREAHTCLGAQAYIASAAMSGRALEALCRDLNADDSMLGKGLKQLHAGGQIDDRLYEWGKELNKQRNIAAHPDPQPISQREAQYVFDFALAIADYVYVLTAKFERFKNGE
jgi:hypothetical protein